MTITEADLLQARTAWGDALVAISKAYENAGIDGARALANDVLDAAYGYNLGPVMFKPTLASGDKTFRPTKDGALAYFVGHDKNYPLDGGFGLKGWRQAEFETSAHFVEGNVGMWMGWGRFTDKDGNVTTVNKTFGYKKDEDGAVRVVLHHSSLPYEP